MFERSAAKGNSSAQLQLGRCYQEGIGTNIDLDTAIEYYKKSDLKGNTSASCFLGIHFQQSDPEKGFEMFEKSARRENSVAEQHLADCYQSGKGVSINLNLAFEYYQ